MTTSIASRAEARFKQLCCLGLGGEAVMPALLRELHGFIPFVNGVFFYNAPDGSLAKIYAEWSSGPQTYLEAFHDGRDHQIPGWGWKDWSQTEVGAHDLEDILTIDKAAFRRTEFFNLVYRPNRTDRLLRLVVRDRGKAIGSTSLYRDGDRPWTKDDKRKLESLEPFFVHALRDVAIRADVALSDSDEEGTILADVEGRPLHMSRLGASLLTLATYERFSPATRFAASPMLPPPLVAICRQLARIFDGAPGESAPVYHHRNAWGGFTFRAHWLERSEPRTIAISVRHREPVEIKLLRRAGQLPLSRRQAEVAFHLASGASHDDIAERLGISRNTAIAHGRWVYTKLDVHNRAELVGKLLAN